MTPRIILFECPRCKKRMFLPYNKKGERPKCLGNAVVPQVAEVFTKAIREYEEKVI